MDPLRMTRPVTGTLSAAPTGVRRTTAADGAPADLADLLTEVTGGLTAAERESLAIVISAREFGLAQAARFVGLCADTGRRLRPSASLNLETSRLVARFAADGRWSGPCLVLMPAEAGPAAAIATAAARIARGDPAVAVCEIGPGDENCYHVAACLVRPGQGQDHPDRPVADATAPADLLALWKAGALWKAEAR